MNKRKATGIEDAAHRGAVFQTAAYSKEWSKMELFLKGIKSIPHDEASFLVTTITTIVGCMKSKSSIGRVFIHNDFGW